MSAEFDDKPWTERQWEEFMRQSELRAARFGELFETLRDDPQCDELIDREMGWGGDREEYQIDGSLADAESAADEFADESEADEFEADDDEAEELSDEEVQAAREHKRSRLTASPAYSAGYQWGLAVYKLLETAGERDEDFEEIAARAVEGSTSVAAKIAAGNGLGEEDDSICGNIVCCRRAAAFAQQAIDALKELAGRGGLPADALQALIDEGARVRSLVEERIAELRSRVWWE